MQRYFARRPILDRYEKVYGYQILFRPEEEEVLATRSGDGAANNTHPGVIDWDGIDKITEGTRAFIPCPRQTLIGGDTAGLPRDLVGSRGACRQRTRREPGGRLSPAQRCRVHDRFGKFPGGGS